MKDLHRKAVIGILRTFVILGIAVFVPAGTLRYWQGWTCLAAFFVPACALTVWVAKNDPALLERRIKAGPAAEKEIGQKIVQVVAAAVFFADCAVPALDHRLGWSSVPTYAAIAGDVLMVLGFVLVFAVFKENSYTSGTIEVAENQTVISTGPYAVVRHPMYSGALVMLYGIRLALGSGAGELVNVLLTAALIWRLLDEERFLVKNLNGYAEYRERVKYRLIPLMW
jgi:protein-S-isoprenylcysteine O-methyltransferase Ste14